MYPLHITPLDSSAKGVNLKHPSHYLIPNLSFVSIISSLAEVIFIILINPGLRL